MRYERRPRLEISDRLIVDGDGAGTFETPVHIGRRPWDCRLPGNRAERAEYLFRYRSSEGSV